MTGKVMETVVKLMGSIDPSLAKSIGTAQSSFKKMGKSVAVAGKALGGIATVGVAAAGAVTGYLIKSGTDYIKTMNDVSAQTGMTGDELKEFGDTTREIWKNGGGENLQEVADALVNIKQTSGLAGDELKNAAESALLIKDTFDFEVNESTRAASALMKNFGISADEAYGLIAVGAQNGANKNDDLLDTLNEYSVHYQNLGLDADQFVSSLVAGAENGAFSIDKVGDAVKEFSIRSQDGSDATIGAFEQIGLDAKTMTAAFSMGGDAAEAAFFQTIDALNAMEDPFQQNQAGVALFGTMFEDLGDGVLDTLSSMNGASLDAKEALEQMEKVKYNDLGYSLEQVKRTMLDAFIPSAEKIGQAMYEIMPEIKAGFEDLAPVIGTLGEGFVAILPVIMDFLQQMMPILGDLITQLTPFLTELFVKFGEIFSLVAPMLLNLITTLLPPLMAIINAIIPPIMQILEGILPPILELVTALAPVIGVIATLIGTALTQAINIVLPIVQNLIGIFTNLIDFIVNIFTGNWGAAWENIVGIFENIVGYLSGIFKLPINLIIGIVNTAIKGFNMIKLPDWVPGIGGKGINIPEIPLLAKGGFTKGISIAGEAGTEAVISFDPAYRSKNIDTWLKAGELLGVASSGNISNNIHNLSINFKIENNSPEEDVVSKIKNNLPDIIDEFMNELNRRTANEYSSYSYS